jgi:tRNA dimethylallyltransferase
VGLKLKSLNSLPLIVIVGPTASGKTSLAVELARRFNGEVVCADSRTIYKGMDIGTAKPGMDEMKGVVHHGLDLVEPGDYYSAADFKLYADRAISEIRQRGHIPFLVGGTGLYVDSVIFDYQFGTKSDNELRSKLDNLSINELHNIYNETHLVLPENNLNKRYLIRGIERSGSTHMSRGVIIENAFIVGITTEKDVLRLRISERINQFFDNGVIDEARALVAKYGWDSEAMTGNVYRLSKDYIAEQISEIEMKQKLVVLDWRLAKRQMTWFKRNPFIKWGSVDETRSYLSNLLENLG